MTRSPFAGRDGTIQSDKKLSVTSRKTTQVSYNLQGGSNMTGTDLCVNKPHCAAAVRP